MTGYHLRLGYDSGCSGSRSDEERWRILLEVVEAIRMDPERIARDAALVEGVDVETAREYAAAFATRGPDCGPNDLRQLTEDLTLVVFLPSVREDRIGEVVSLASGWGPARRWKERTRRAFCRLVIHDMHRKGAEVCLSVG